MNEQTPRPGTAIAAQKTPRDQLIARRRFRPEFLAEIQAQLREAFGLAEDDPLPDVFRVPIAVPLKIGIAPDLQNRYRLRNPNHPGHRLLKGTLKRYCRSVQYHHAILSTRTRFDMNLKPAQNITDKDRHDARIKLEWYEKKRKKAQTHAGTCARPPDGPA